MSVERNDKTILRLLSGTDRLSGAEKEVILAGVLAAVERRPRRRRLVALGAAGAVAAAAVVLLLVLRPPDRAAGSFTPRGAGDANEAAASFEARCAGAAGPGRCRPGDKLLFEVSAAGSARFFAAFARRGDGTVIWYFPPPGGQSLALGERAPRGVLDAGILLGPEHPPGRYRIVGVFSPRPLSRDQVREAAASGAAGEAVLVSRELVVE